MIDKYFIFFHEGQLIFQSDYPSIVPLASITQVPFLIAQYLVNISLTAAEAHLRTSSSCA